MLQEYKVEILLIRSHFLKSEVGKSRKSRPRRLIARLNLVRFWVRDLIELRVAQYAAKILNFSNVKNSVLT